jgi:CHAD domain-containing protein
MSMEPDDRDQETRAPVADTDGEAGTNGEAPTNGQRPVPASGAGDRPGKLALADDDSLHGALSTAFADLITYARSMTAEVDQDPVRAIHEYRKSLRRARALVKMMAGALGDEATAELTDGLQRAQRATSDVRDGDVLRARLDDLADARGWRKLVPELRQGLDAPEHGAAYARSVLDMGAGLIDGLPARFDQALPADVGWDAVGAGLKDSYRCARKRLAAARKGKGKGSDLEPLHDFRKRAKELTYQVELLAAGQGGALRKEHRSLARLSEKLGDITDLILLRGHIATGLDGQDKGAKRRRKLARRVDRRIERRVSRVLSKGRALFGARPKRFAGKLVDRRRPD